MNVSRLRLVLALVVVVAAFGLSMGTTTVFGQSSSSAAIGAGTPGRAATVGHSRPGDPSTTTSTQADGTPGGAGDPTGGAGPGGAASGTGGGGGQASGSRGSRGAANPTGSSGASDSNGWGDAGPLNGGSVGLSDPAGVAAIPAEAAYIESAQLPNGAIVQHPGSAVMNPYLGAYAAAGLARAAQVTGDAGMAVAAWRWLKWYAGAEDSSGVVTDATVVSGTTQPDGALDATDATAGMFLVAAENAFGATHDLASLQAIEPGIAGAVRAIVSVQGSDGLTWAKPGFHVKYLMDQAEAYGGLVAASRLASIAGDQATAARATAAANAMATGVAQLWDPATGAYDWAVHGSGDRQTTDWGVAYPDAMEQVWAVAFGLVPPSRSATLMATVLAHVPEWDQPGAIAPKNHDGALVHETLGYWAVTAWALADVGNSAQAVTGASSILHYAVSAGGHWPFSCADAGQLIVAASGGAVLTAL